MNDTIYKLAKMIDHSILHPTMTDVDLVRECEVAKKYDVPSVCVKPYAVKQAVELLKGSNVLIALQVAGCSRCGATATAVMLEEAFKRFGNE